MSGVNIERMSSFKTARCDHLIDFEVGRTCCNDLLENCIQDALSIKIRRAGISQAEALCFYMTVIRPVLEYACPVWHSMLTKKLSSAIRSQQIRVMRIIYVDVKYGEVLVTAGIPTLHDRREMLTSNFLFSIRQPSSCLHHLMPARQITETVSRLRTAVEYAIPFCRTKRFQTSFLPCSLKKFQ